MALTIEDKVSFFSSELSLIYDRHVREFTRLCIGHGPDYFFIDCPSSSTGKFHPLDEITADGSIIHVKKVFTMAYEMVKALECEHNRDLVMSATLLHDIRKQGIEHTGRTQFTHSDLAAQLVTEVQEATQLLTDQQYNIIRNCIGYHMGPWSNPPWKKPMSQYTPEELALFLSDFTVSKRFVSVDYRREERYL